MNLLLSLLVKEVQKISKFDEVTAKVEALLFD